MIAANITHGKYAAAGAPTPRTCHFCRPKQRPHTPYNLRPRPRLTARAPPSPTRPPRPRAPAHPNAGPRFRNPPPAPPGAPPSPPPAPPGAPPSPQGAPPERSNAPPRPRNSPPSPPTLNRPPRAGTPYTLRPRPNASRPTPTPAAPTPHPAAPPHRTQRPPRHPQIASRPQPPHAPYADRPGTRAPPGHAPPPETASTRSHPMHPTAAPPHARPRPGQSGPPKQRHHAVPWPPRQNQLGRSPHHRGICNTEITPTNSMPQRNAKPDPPAAPSPTPGPAGTVAAELIAVLVAVTDGDPRVLTVRGRRRAALGAVRVRPPLPAGRRCAPGWSARRTIRSAMSSSSTPSPIAGAARRIRRCGRSRSAISA